MSDYRNETDTVAVKRRSGGTTIAIILVAIVVIVGLLFATGFWSANVTKDGALPKVAVEGGALPEVDLDSKEVVVGTKKTKVEVPKVKTETETIDVPTVGVKDNGEK
ncbi:beta-lactam-binding protein with PASTA domain [Sphingomonas sp. UYAg733]